MQREEFEDDLNFVFSSALSKCGNLEDAQDLTQETFLDTLVYLARGGEIREIRGWLLTVLNRKFYQSLRKKYKMPVITYGEEFDIVDENDCFANIGYTEEAESIRKAVAYLTKIHRQVIVRHYMHGESLHHISKALHIPQGTVKSRLYNGREQLKRELLMENYNTQSYEPINLHISNSGTQSIKHEPQSLVHDDLIAQNLLYLAYEKPVTEIELSKAIGIPTAYVEPIVKRLIDGELMKRAGNKIFTDFIISTTTDRTKHLSMVKQFVSKNQDLFFEALQNAINKLRQTEFYTKYTSHQKNALELYTAAYCYETGLITAFHQIYDTNQIIPERPNGGRWLAFGNVTLSTETQKEVDEAELEYFKHSFAGMRSVHLNDYLGTKEAEFSVYDLVGFPIRIYYGENNINDEDLLKLLTLIESGTNPDGTGFNIELLKKIPLLVKCGILRYDENNKPVVDIPVVSPEECQIYNQIRIKAREDFVIDIKPVFASFLEGKNQKLPRHLTDIPLLKQYQSVVVTPIMAAIRLAIKNGIIEKSYDYDREAKENERFPYTMLFYMDK